MGLLKFGNRTTYSNNLFEQYRVQHDLIVVISVIFQLIANPCKISHDYMGFHRFWCCVIHELVAISIVEGAKWGGRKFNGWVEKHSTYGVWVQATTVIFMGQVFTFRNGNQQLRSCGHQGNIVAFGELQHDEHAHFPSQVALAFRLQELLVEIGFWCFVCRGLEVRALFLDTSDDRTLETFGNIGKAFTKGIECDLVINDFQSAIRMMGD